MDSYFHQFHVYLRTLFSTVDAPPQKMPNAAKPGTADDSFDDPHKRRNQIVAVIFATAAMIGYALTSGLVKLQIVDSDHGGVEFEYDGDEDGGGEEGEDWSGFVWRLHLGCEELWKKCLPSLVCWWY